MDDLTLDRGAEGCVRTYYGAVLSQHNVSRRDVHATAAHLIGVGDQDAHEILHINEQPYPWLFNIGVF
ncbi:hypothetical protein AC731_005315 [Thauera humireducens]|uniref:Uncharacterized protein n=1 Tax=Thauera humireducens TaxID=1134435 RepID=A0A127K474_9RHOO|nr:hypothetical protein AC731_005315 [Thauera humireducens]